MLSLASSYPFHSCLPFPNQFKEWNRLAVFITTARRPSVIIVRKLGRKNKFITSPGVYQAGQGAHGQES